MVNADIGPIRAIDQSIVMDPFRVTIRIGAGNGRPLDGHIRRFVKIECFIHPTRDGNVIEDQVGTSRTLNAIVLITINTLIGRMIGPHPYVPHNDVFG